MPAIEILINRFRKKPNDFIYNELKRLLHYLGYTEKQGSGSRVVFANEKTSHKIKLHKPHPGNLLTRYQLDLLESELNLKNLK